MIADPYKVLGVSPSASSDEIKKAYRELSKKYHPDSYMNNPLSELAEEKFKEVQEAYEQIMQKGTTYDQGSYSGTGGEASEMNSVYNFLNARRYTEALNVLSGISNRTARWYYCSAIANSGIGNNILASEHARQAVAMEPGNQEYTKLLNQMQWQSQRYQSTGYNNGRSGLGTGNLCCDLWCADSLCECMGGDLCSCF